MKVDKWLCDDTAMFWKKRIEEYDTDDENEEVDDFIQDEDDCSELIRMLK